MEQEQKLIEELTENIQNIQNNSRNNRGTALADSYLARAEKLKELKRIDECFRDIELAINCCHGDLDVICDSHLLKIDYFLERKDLEGAESTMNKLLQYFPFKDLSTQLRMGKIAMFRNDYDKAARFFEHVVENAGHAILYAEAKDLLALCCGESLKQLEEKEKEEKEKKQKKVKEKEKKKEKKKKKKKAK